MLKQISSVQQLIDIATQKDVPISQLILEYEQYVSDTNAETVLNHTRHILKTMYSAIEEGIHSKERSHTGLSGGDAYLYDKKGSLLEGVAAKALVNAIAASETNGRMGKIAACPTAGASGVTPGALFATADKLGKTHEDLVYPLLTASGIGVVINHRAFLAGALGGCQAEVGSAAAMTAGAIVELAGGSPRQVGQAAALAMKNLLGLPCDPVAGLVEVPCVKRNGMGALVALAAADLALAGVESTIPVDEVIDTMAKIGKDMPIGLKETATGGLAITPTALSLTEKILGS